MIRRDVPALILQSQTATLLTALVACGGAYQEVRERPALADGCAGLRSEVLRTQARLEACVQDAMRPAWVHQALFDAALSEVRALARQAAASGHVEPHEAQDAADACWSFFDAVAPELTSPISLDAAEDATEGLLRDREGDAAVHAAAAAERALEELRATLVPELSIDPCGEARASVEAARSEAANCR